MKLADFDYALPPERIAQTPAPERDQSRLLVLDRASDTLADRVFSEIGCYLNAGDVLVLNETKVIPARLLGHRESGGQAELLLLQRREGDTWGALVKPGRKLLPGQKVYFDVEDSYAEIIDATDEGSRLVTFHYEGIWEEWLDKVGVMPLPPYIHGYRGDMARYQTVFARYDGSVAAPTAGLHFTPALLDELAAQGVEIVKVTLHVGIGTFRPLTVENVEDHQMHAEYYEIDTSAAAAINGAKEAGRRVIACGTTSTRVLESAAGENGRLQPQAGWTDAYFYPGYTFRVIDGLITNFHLPKSSLLLLVAALAGRTRILDAYRHAIDQGYRFFSFGDAMLIL